MAAKKGKQEDTFFPRWTGIPGAWDYFTEDAPPGSLREDARKHFNMGNVDRPDQRVTSEPMGSQHTIDNDLTVLIGRINALAGKVGPEERERIERLMPGIRDRVLRDRKVTPEQKDQFYYTLWKLHDSLQKRVQGEGTKLNQPLSSQEVLDLLPQERLFDTQTSPRDDPRRPEGVPEFRQDINRLQPPEEGPPIMKGPRHEPPKKPGPSYEATKQMLEGIFSPEEREMLKQRYRDEVLAGRDMSGEGRRRGYLFGNNMGRAITGGFAVGGSGQFQKNALLARDMINENEARAEGEYERPERLRQERMAEALKAMTQDRTFAKLFDQTSEDTLSIGGQQLDPALANRPEAAPLWTEAVAQGAGRLDPRGGDYIARTEAGKVHSAQAEQEAKAQERLAKIEKMLSEAELASERAKYAGKAKPKAGEVSPEVEVVAAQLAAEDARKRRAQFQTDYDSGKGRHWYTPWFLEDRPEEGDYFKDVPGYSGPLNEPDMDYWRAVAQAALANGGTAPGADPSKVVR